MLSMCPRIVSLVLLTLQVTVGPSGQAFAAPQSDIVVDAVVATVDDKPITLSELRSRLVPPRHLSLAEAKRDQEALKTLDALILEKLIEQEAAAKRISATDADIEEYLNEVAKRNTLSKAEFEKALLAEGRSLSGYKQQVRLDILKTRLISSMARGGVSVSDAEVDEYVRSHSETNQTGESVKLRQIFISSFGRDATTLEARATEVSQALEAGDGFAEIAQRFSEGPHASEGGLIGVVATSDLSESVANTVASLDEGEWSTPVESDGGLQIFFVEQRFENSDDQEENQNEELRNEARQSLQQQKSQEKLSSFFSSELYKNHAVDKKL